MANEQLDPTMIGTNVKWNEGAGTGEAVRIPVGPCPHKLCKHLLQITVAQGGTLEHYELKRCDEPAPIGCAGNCRGWFSATHPRGTDKWIEVK
jgi:hypothetical protein